MPWRGPRKQHRDPIYASRSYRAARAYYRAIGAACAICRRPIDYTANAGISPIGYHLDHHPVTVSEGRARGWTDELLNALTNTRPTHRRCNVKLGARLGQRRQRRKAKVRKLIANTSREW